MGATAPTHSLGKKDSMKIAQSIIIGLEPDDDPAKFGLAETERRLHLMMGDDIPDEIAARLPDSMILDKLVAKDANSLSKEQLIAMLGVEEDPEELAPIEYDESELRDALAELRTKADLVEWFKTIRPDGSRLDITLTRSELEDEVVDELIGE